MAIQGLTREACLRGPNSRCAGSNLLYSSPKEEEWPQIEITLTHPLDGEVPVLIFDPDSQTCSKCTLTKLEGFAYLEVEELAQLLQPNPKIENRFFAARSYLFGEAERDFLGNESNFGGDVWRNAEFIDFEGFTLEQFKATKHRCPIAMRVPCIRRRHLLTNVMTDFYFAPKPGPSMTLRITREQFNEHKRNTMIKQVYTEQGVDTLERMGMSMKAQIEFQGLGLMDNTDFERLRSNTVARSGVRTPMASHSGSQSSAWTDDGAPGLQPAASKAPIAAAGKVGSAGPPRAGLGAAGALNVPIAKASSNESVNNRKVSTGARKDVGKTPGPTALLSTPSAAACANRIRRSSALGARPGSSVSLPSPTAKKQNTATSVLSSSGSPSHPPAKNASHLTLGPGGPGRGELVLPGMVSSKISSGASSVGETCLDFKGLGHSETCKYKRAKLQCPLQVALRGVNMKEALSNLRKMKTQAQRGDMLEVYEELRDHEALVVHANLLVWLNMADQNWQVVYEAAEVLKAPYPFLPMEFFFFYAGRWALDMVAPRAAKDNYEKFWIALDFQPVGVPKRPYSLEHPSVWCDTFEDSEIRGCGPHVLATVIQNGIWVPLLRKGLLGKDALMASVNAVLERVMRYPKELLGEALVGLVNNAYSLCLLFGPTPFYRGSSIDHLQRSIKEKKSRLAHELNQAGSFAKAFLDQIWTLHASEKEVWPTIQKLYLDKRNETSTLPFVECALANFVEWKSKVRPATSALIQQDVTTDLLKLFEGADFSDAVNEENVTVCRSLVQHARKAVILWNNNAIKQVLNKTLEFSAKVTNLDMNKAIISGGETVMAAEQLTEEIVMTFKLSLPSVEGVRIIVVEKEEVDLVNRTFSNIVGVVFGCFPSGADSAGVTMLFNEKIGIGEGEDLSAQRASFGMISADANLLSNLHAIAKQHLNYLALGDTVQARVQADPHLVHVKMLIHSRDRVAWPLGEEIRKKFGRVEAVDELCDGVEASVKEHGSVFLAQTTPALTDAIEAIKPFAGGGADEKSWKEGLPDDCTLEELQQTAGRTIRNLVPETYIPLLRTLNQEWLRHTVRSDLFQVEVESNLKKSVIGTMKAARVTLTEHYLATAAAYPAVQAQAAKEVINAQVQAWDALEIRTVDVHSKLWQVCRGITSGKPVKE